MTTATTLDRNAHANELDTEGQPTGGFPDRYEDEAPALDVSLYHEPTAADQQWVASRALTLAEQVDREADRYRLDRSPLAVLCARTLDELALKLRMTEASTAEEYEARREVLDATIRDEWEARGYEAGARVVPVPGCARLTTRGAGVVRTDTSPPLEGRTRTMTTTPTLATPAPCTCHERPSRTTTKPRRAGFPLLRCPRCGRDGMVIEVDRATLHCCECGSNGDPITAAEIHALIDQWRRFLAWFERSADAPGEDR